MTEQDGENNRQYLRIPILLQSKVTISGDPSEESMEMKNISFGGAFLRYEEPFPPQTLLDMRFLLPGNENPIEATGFVCWNTKENGHSGMGIQFIVISKNDQELLKKFIRRFTGELTVNVR